MNVSINLKSAAQSGARDSGKDVVLLQKLHLKLDYFLRRYKLWVIVFLLGLTLAHICEVVFFPTDIIIPQPFLLGFLLVGMTFLWIQEMRDRVILENINRILSDLDEMKTRFITIAGHELYTPLAIIKQYTDLMKEKILGELTSEQQKALVSIENSGERLYNIVSQVLLIKSIDFDKGKQRERLEKKMGLFEFFQLVKSIENEVAPMVQKRKQTFEFKMPSKIQKMYGHKEGIYQVLVNLLLNAIRFTPDGGHIMLHAEETPHSYQIGVRDTGIGIDPKEQEKIFESFYEVKDPRYHSFGKTEFNSSGLGLGLTICKNIVEAHGGRIWVDSQLGKYSDFIFTLPKIKTANQESQKETSVKLFSSAQNRFKKSA